MTRLSNRSALRWMTNYGFYGAFYQAQAAANPRAAAWDR